MRQDLLRNGFEVYSFRAVFSENTKETSDNVVEIT